MCGTFLGSFDRSAVSLSNLKIDAYTHTLKVFQTLKLNEPKESHTL